MSRFKAQENPQESYPLQWSEEQLLGAQPAMDIGNTTINWSGSRLRSPLKARSVYAFANVYVGKKEANNAA